MKARRRQRRAGTGPAEKRDYSHLPVGLVLRARAGFVEILPDAGGEIQVAKIRGRLKREQRRTDLCVVGDRVRFDDSGDTPMVEEVLDRRSVFSRLHPGQGRPREDVLIANLDVLLIVFAFGEPPANPRLLDRFLTIAEFNQIEPIVIANKSDMADDNQREVFAPYRELGYRVVETCALDPQSVDGVRDLLGERIGAFVGASGVGKSSLMNALDPELGLLVAETSEAHAKGRHTTRVATLFPLGSGYVADTPGIRELATWSLPDEELASCFVEMRPFLGQCRYRDCSHVGDPDCAIEEAVGEAISEERYESFLRLYEEAERPDRHGK